MPFPNSVCVYFFRKPLFKFCYHCGRSVSVVLTPCSRCHKVYYCSRSCKLKAWDKLHKDECVLVSGGYQGYSVQHLEPSKPKQNQHPKPTPFFLLSHCVFWILDVGRWSHALDDVDYLENVVLSYGCKCFDCLSLLIQHLLKASRRMLCINPKEDQGPWLSW